MVVKIYTQPAIEPVSLADLKLHLRLDSGSFADNIDETQSIAPGSHAIANNYTTHVGTGVDVLGYTAVVMLQAGTNGATGTVDVKIQESDDNSTWTDWADGAFTQITTANDNATYEKAYTGSKQYIRTVAKVLLAACEFGTTVIRLTATTAEDDLLTALIPTARQQVEAITQRALITQTWDAYLDCFPEKDFFELPFGQLQSVVASSFTYTDSDGTVTTMAATTDFLVDSSSEPGRIVLPYGMSWPSPSFYPVNPITLRFICGYGTTAASVPAGIRTAIKMMAEDMFNNRSAQIPGEGIAGIKENKTVMNLLYPFRLWGF